MKHIQWYPGHMTRARRMIVDSLKHIDIVIELVDARAPSSTRNPDFDDLFSKKERIIVLNKNDLADESMTKEWVKYYNSNGWSAISFVSNESKQKGKALRRIEESSEKIIAKNAEKGIKKTVRVLVAGIPNVGKSSFINTISGYANANTGNRPGLTRGKQWVRISPYLELMDTPGMLWPKLENQQAALYLAFIEAIRDEVLDTETLATQLIELLINRWPDYIIARYKKLEVSTEKQDYLDVIGRTRGFLLKGGEVDCLRAANTVLDEFRAGKIGRFTLDELPIGE